MATITVNQNDNPYDKINSAQPGDVVQFASGIWDVKNYGNRTINCNGTNANKITIQGQPDFSTIITDTSAPKEGKLFRFFNASHLIIKRLRLEFPMPEGNLRTDLNKTRDARDGMLFSGTDDILLTENYFYNITNSGFNFNQKINPDNTNIVVELNFFDKIGNQTNGGDMRNNGGNGPFVFRRNLCFGNVDGYVQDGSPDGNQIVEENIIANQRREDCIDFKRVDKNCSNAPSIVRNNILYCNVCPGTGMTMQNNTCNVQIYDNIIYAQDSGPNFAGIWFHARNKGTDPQPTRNIDCYNNVLIGPKKSNDRGIYTKRCTTGGSCGGENTAGTFDNILIRDNYIVDYNNPIVNDYSVGVEFRDNITGDLSIVPQDRLDYFTNLEWSIQNELEGIFPRSFFEEAYQWAQLPYTPTGSTPPTEPPPDPPPDPEPPPEPPPGGGDDIVQIDDWQYGFNRAISAGASRIAIVCIGIEANTPVITNLTWGGVPVNELFNEPVTGISGSSDNRLYVGYLTEAEIVTMVGDFITHDGTNIDSVITGAFENMSQTTLVGDTASGKISGGGTSVDCSSAVGGDEKDLLLQFSSSGTEGTTVAVTAGMVNQIDDSRLSQVTSIADRIIGAAFSGVTCSHQWTASSSRRIIFAAAFKPSFAPMMQINDLLHSEHSMGLPANIIVPTYKTVETLPWVLGESAVFANNTLYKNRLALISVYERRLLSDPPITSVNWAGMEATEAVNISLEDATYRYHFYLGAIFDDDFITTEDSYILVDGDDPQGMVYTAQYANVNQQAFFDEYCQKLESISADTVACDTAVRSRDKSHTFAFGLNEDGTPRIFDLPPNFSTVYDDPSPTLGASMAEYPPVQ